MTSRRAARRSMVPTSTSSGSWLRGGRTSCRCVPSPPARRPEATMRDQASRRETIAVRDEPIPRDEPLSLSLRGGMILAALLTPFGSTSIAVALPGIGRELGAGRAELNLWLVVSYLLVAI